MSLLVVLENICLETTKKSVRDIFVVLNLLSFIATDGPLWSEAVVKDPGEGASLFL